MKAAFVAAALLIATAFAMVGVVCFGSWLDGSGGCPAKMPWEIRRGA